MKPSADIMPQDERDGLVRLVVMVPPAMRDRLQKEADRRTSSKSQVVRDAILSHLPATENQAAA